jgi:hypothetical protein
MRCATRAKCSRWPARRRGRRVACGGHRPPTTVRATSSRRTTSPSAAPRRPRSGHRRRAGSLRYRPRRCAGLCAAGDARTLHSYEAKRGHIDHQPARVHLDRAPHRAAQLTTNRHGRLGQPGVSGFASPRVHGLLSRTVRRDGMPPAAMAARRSPDPEHQGARLLSTRCPFGSCRRSGAKSLVVAELGAQAPIATDEDGMHTAPP